MTLPRFTPNRRVLIVDDNPAIHEDYKKILGGKPKESELEDLSALVFGEENSSEQDHQVSFELTSALQGQEARELVEQSLVNNTPYAMAFVDMRMPPGWDGLQTIEEIWKVDPNLQIVICTAYSDYSWSEIVGRLAQRDKLLILKKPFDNVEVSQLALALTSKWDLERLAEAERGSIIETAADGILSISSEGNIEIANQAASRLFGYEREEIIGVPFQTLLPESEQETWKNYVCELDGRPGGCVCGREIEGITKDGASLPMLISVSEIPTPEGIRRTVIVRDLTEFKFLQNRLAEARRLESIGQLASGIAHEINTPLQFIYSNFEYLQAFTEHVRVVVDLLESNVDIDAPAKEWETRWKETSEAIEKHQLDKFRAEIPSALAETLEGLERVVGIVRTVKEFTHPGQEEKFRCDLHHAIDGALTITRNRWRNVAGIDLFKTEGELEVCGLIHELNQVLVNLLVNAVDAIVEQWGEADETDEKQGLITIRTAREEQHAVIEIEDNGVGMTDAVRERMFDPFYTTKEIGKGTGQGLALAYNCIVGHHGGSIDVKTTPGAGTTFTLRIPWADETCTLRPAEAEPELAGALRDAVMAAK